MLAWVLVVAYVTLPSYMQAPADDFLPSEAAHMLPFEAACGLPDLYS